MEGYLRAYTSRGDVSSPAISGYLKRAQELIAPLPPTTAPAN